METRTAAEAFVAYARWFGRQPLAANTRRTYEECARALEDDAAPTGCGARCRGAAVGVRSQSRRAKV